MGYDAEQQRVIRKIKRIGRKRGEGRVKIKAALEAGKVESNYRNLAGGDADSQGWRQERASLYKDPRNLKASVNRFYDEADKLYTGQRAGQLAADVQRPAAQYRGRYGQVAGEAKRLLRGGVGGGGAAGTPGSRTTTTTTSADMGARTATRQAAALQYLQSSDRPDALLNLAVGLSGANQTRTSTDTTRTPGTKGYRGDQGSGGGGAAAAVAFAESKLGKAETGKNTGPYVDKLEKRFGFKAAPWCAMFTSSAVVQGGAPKSARTASVATVRAKAHAKDGYVGFVRPGHEKAGDLILFGNDHIGMVVGVSAKGITMIAGNDSDRVNRRVVARGSGDVVRPAYSKGRR